MNLIPPTFSDVQSAAKAIEGKVHRTPIRFYPALSELLEADVWVKHENFQLLGAFKVRGGINLISKATDDERARGYVSASSGNHGQSIAYAARLFGAKCTMVLPEGANPAKAASIKALGAELLFHGDVFERAKELAESLAEERGYRFIHAANEPDLIAGVGTYTLEVHEDLKDIDVMIAPVGAGSGACGACIVMNEVSPETHMIGVQSAGAPAAHHAWKPGEFSTIKMNTIAEGLATEGAYELPISILRERLPQFELVDDSEILNAIRIYVEATRTLVEHAGAASLAAAIKLKDQLKGKRVVLVASGGNITVDQLKTALG